MGIFSYKKNLISKNIAELSKKASILSTQLFVKYWIISCLDSIKYNLETIFFGKKREEFATLKKNLDKLNKDIVYEIIKILVSFYMSFTKVNPSFSKFLKAIGLKQKDFEDEIFSFFAFNNEDIEEFRELDNQYKQGTLSPFTIPRKILEIAFDIKSPSIGFFEVVKFRILLNASFMGFQSSFEIWMSSLEHKLHKTNFLKKIINVMKNEAKKTGESVTRDFHSVMKSLKIEPGSLDEKIISDYIDTLYTFERTRDALTKLKLTNLEKALTPIQKQGVDYCKKVNSMLEFLEKEV